MQITATHKCWEGELSYVRHASKATGTDMIFTVYLPPKALAGEACPTLLWLSGLTCTADNFTVKGGAYGWAAEAGVIIVNPDTSPRNHQGDEGVADDADDYAMGQGAGYYLDATEAPWASHFRMESYVASDLLPAAQAVFPIIDLDRVHISGHSMGGHGALTMGLKYPQMFKSIAAVAPICAASRCPWGEKALPLYLGDVDYTNYDASLLMEAQGDRSYAPEILIDQGTADPFLSEQLKPEILIEACRKVGQKLTYRAHDGYDHGFFFITGIVQDHINRVAHLDAALHP